MNSGYMDSNTDLCSLAKSTVLDIRACQVPVVMVHVLRGFRPSCQVLYKTESLSPSPEVLLRTTHTWRLLPRNHRGLALPQHLWILERNSFSLSQVHPGRRCQVGGQEDKRICDTVGIPQAATGLRQSPGGQTVGAGAWGKLGMAFWGVSGNLLRCLRSPLYCHRAWCHSFVSCPVPHCSHLIDLTSHCRGHDAP